jgi:hypothetical protein
MVKKMRSLFSLTVRQRILIYLMIAALAGLACAGVDITIDANRMDLNVPAIDSIDCNVKSVIFQCTGAAFDGTCHLKACARPPASPDRPMVNCSFGSTNRGRPWIVADCQAKAVAARCSEVTLFSFGCHAYNCLDTRCAK